MLFYNYKKVFELRGILHPYKYLIENGFTRSVAYSVAAYHNRSMRLKTIDKLCTLLSCTPNDLLAWVPNKDSQIPENHPLRKLQKTDPYNFASITKDVPASKIPELLKIVEEAKSKLSSE